MLCSSFAVLLEDLVALMMISGESSILVSMIVRLPAYPLSC
jgi:hypothetical protein